MTKHFDEIVRLLKALTGEASPATILADVSDRDARLLGRAKILDSGGAVITPLTDAQLRASAVPVTGPLTDTQLRATAIPVSGPLTDTQLRASAVAVSGPLTDAQLRAAEVPVATGVAPLKSINQGDGVANGTAQNLVTPRSEHTLQLVLSGSPTGGVVKMQGSNDGGTTWEDIVVFTIGTDTGNAKSATGKPFQRTRAAITTALSGGTTPKVDAWVASS